MIAARRSVRRWKKAELTLLLISVALVIWWSTTGHLRNGRAGDPKPGGAVSLINTFAVCTCARLRPERHHR